MGIAFDNASSAFSSAVTNMSWTHTAGGINVMASIGIAYRGNAGGATFSAVAYGGVAMTQKSKTTNNNGGASDISLAVYTLANAGVGNKVISVAATLSDAYDVLGITHTGTNTASGGGTASVFTAAAGTSPFNLSISSQVSQIALAFASDVNNFGANDKPGQYRRAWIIDDGAGVYLVASEKPAGSATTSFSWSASAGQTSRWCASGFGFSATAGATFVCNKTLLGVGM